MTEDTELDRVVRKAGELSQEVGRPLRRMTIRSEDLAVELEWPDPATGGGTAVAAPAAAAEAESPAEDDDHRVTAPLVGTFYEAPEPGRPPFVRVGDVVEAGQQIGIVEAMKLMNVVETDRSGRVVEVLVDDGAPVQFGDPLVVLHLADDDA